MPTPRAPDRRERVAAVAAELFAARGYRAVGINDIAAAAGVTGPALYRHFPDKQAILNHVLLCAVDQVRRTTVAALSGAAGPGGAALAALLAAQAASAVERRDIAAVWRFQERHLSTAQRREFARRSTGVLESWAKVLLDARPDLAPADAELLCWASLSVFGSVSTHHTSVAKPRFVQLLAGVAGRVVHAHLPVADGTTAGSVGTAGSAGSAEGRDETTEGAGREAGVPSGRVAGAPSRREQLLAAATDLFHRYGFRDVTMEDIGRAVGIAGPSVYRHFPGKQAILYAIAHRAADRLAMDAEHAVRTGATDRQALMLLVASYVRVLTASRELTVAFSVDIDAANLADADHAHLVGLQRDYVGRWAGLLQAARPDLNLREARITVHAALAIANDLARTRRFGTRPALPAELAALMGAALDIGEAPDAG